MMKQLASEIIGLGIRYIASQVGSRVVENGCLVAAQQLGEGPLAEAGYLSRLPQRKLALLVEASLNQQGEVAGIKLQRVGDVKR